MKRKHAFAALIPALALSLSACGGNPVPAESEDTPDTPPVSEPVGSQLPEGALVEHRPKKPLEPVGKSHHSPRQGAQPIHLRPPP